MLKIYTEIKQGSDEWFELRKGKMTASNATAIGTCGKGLDTYVLKKVAEVLSSGKRDTYTNKDLDRGNELEPIARSIYELETGDDVYEVGFIEKDKYSGCSPDGLVREDGGIEIKCVDDIHYLKILLSDKIESGYNWQIQMSLFISGRKWWDFVAYNPNFKNSIIIKRVLPNKEKFEKLKQGLKEGEKQIKLILNKLK